MITELDVDVLPVPTPSVGADVAPAAESRDRLNPFAAGLPDSVQVALAKRYADLLSEFLVHRDVITRVTFWGVTDGDSWLNNWPVRGRTSHPLLFDRRGLPKPAFDAVVGVARKSLARR
jgi:endo-1,4-beta-xylanase